MEKINKQEPIPVTRRSDEELKIIAYRIVEKGDIYIDRYLGEDKDQFLFKVFAPLLLVEAHNIPKLQAEVGMFIAEKASASGQTVYSAKTNRHYDMFLSIKMIHKDDMEVLSKWLDFYTEKLRQNGKLDQENKSRKESIDEEE